MTGQQQRDELRRQIWNGWTFQSTRLTEEFNYSDYLDTRTKDTKLILWVKPNGQIHFKQGRGDAEPGIEDVLIAFGPASERDTNQKPNTSSEKF